MAAGRVSWTDDAMSQFMTKPPKDEWLKAINTDEIFFKNPADIAALEGHAVFKYTYIGTAIAIVLGTLLMVALGFGLYADRKLDENDNDASNTAIVLSTLAIPVGILLFMALQDIRDGVGLFSIILVFAMYVSLYAIRLERASRRAS